MQLIKIGSDGCPLDKPQLAAFQDEKAGLMWCAIDVSTEAMTHEKATAIVAALRTAGFNDWRLPELHELETRRDLKRCNPAADPEFGLRSADYWTRTEAVWAPGAFWIVHFNSGGVGADDSDGRAFVRAVRSVRAGQ